jgi:uncharacterized protein
MSGIEIERNPSQERLAALGLSSWPIWEKEVSTFDWHYDERETCYLLAGRVRVAPAVGAPVEFGAGDLVVFPAGLDCVWTITEPVRKHYRFG